MALVKFALRKEIRYNINTDWSHGVAWLTRCPVKAETAGSNPVDSAI